jgi:hypothetical protein
MKPTLFITLFAIFMLTACTAAPVVTPTPTLQPTATAQPTLTPTPQPTGTETVTPTPEGINQEMFHTLPANYEYLLSHRSEFVQAPDPVSDRAAFDRWWSQELIPALGPVSERPLTANTLNMIDSRFSYMAEANGLPIPVIGPTNFFYFENDGIIYPVLCMNITSGKFPGETRMTLCAALTDYVPLSRAGTNSLEMFASPTDFVWIEIYSDLSYRSDVDRGRLTELVPELGGYYNDAENKVIFGFGNVIFERNY